MKDNFAKQELGNLAALGRTTLKESLGLTGAEVSANRLNAGQAVPFIHSHKRNEEIYLFTSGKGLFWLDGKLIPISEGSAVRVDPAAKRCLKADEGSDLVYFCIQVDQGSLVQFTNDDGIIAEEKPSW